jgi:WS/DGAT/MGAT family acyltransferase
MWFLPGLADHRIGWFVRVPHVMADGITGVAELGALLDAVPSPAEAPTPPWVAAPRPSARALLRDTLQGRITMLKSASRAVTHPAATLHRVRAGTPALSELLAEKPGPETSLNRVIGQDRSLALLRSSLETIEEVADEHDATVNDVLLAVIAGGLRGLLSSRGETVAGVTLPIYVPVSLRRGVSDQAAGNLISQMVVPLPLGIADPGRRLRQIAVETARRKAIARPSLGTMFHGKLVRGVMLKLIVRQRVNVVSADLPGPTAPLYFAGALLIEVFPLVNLVGTESLGVGALSYAGQFNVLAVADADAYPDLDAFADSACEDLRALVQTTAGFAADATGSRCRRRDGV